MQNTLEDSKFLLECIENSVPLKVRLLVANVTLMPAESVLSSLRRRPADVDLIPVSAWFEFVISQITNVKFVQLGQHLDSTTCQIHPISIASLQETPSTLLFKGGQINRHFQFVNAISYHCFYHSRNGHLYRQY